MAGAVMALAVTLPVAGQAPPAATPAPAPAATPAPNPDRVTFEFRLPAERGGGTVVGSATQLEAEGEARAVLSGAVEMKYKDLVLRADRVVYLRTEQRVQAEGNVILDQGPQRLAGRTLDLDLTTRNGTLAEATAHLSPDYYFTGDEVARVGEDTYVVRHGVLTSCSGDATPDWSFRLSSARIELGGYARIRNASAWAKKMPLFYFPYILWPAKTERTSGLLIPNLGYSERRGSYIGLAWFQTLGRSWDTTLSADLFGKDYLGFGQEVRYRPSQGTKGEAYAYFIRDPLADEWRWKAEWDHVSDDLPFGLRGLISYRDFSDFEFFRDFERLPDLYSIRTVPSIAFLSGSWGPQSMNFFVERRRTFISADSIIEQNQYPTLEYALNKLKLGRTPLYLSIDAEAGLLANNRGDASRASYGRLDVAPELTLPLRAFPWLSVSLSAGGRASWYGKSRPDFHSTPDEGPAGAFCGNGSGPEPNGYCADSFTRVSPAVVAEVVGPVFSRIFERPAGGFAKFKHLIEPRWSYTYVGKFDDPERIPLFDERDRSFFTHVAELALVNRLVAKPADESKGGAREILSLEISQAYGLDAEEPLQRSRDGTTTSRQSGLFGTMRFNPSERASVQAQVQYNTLFGGLESSSVTSSLALDRVSAALSWFTRWDAELGETHSDQVRAAIGATILPNRLSVSAQLHYDILGQLLQKQSYFLDYTSQCWSVHLEYREYTTIDRKDRDWRIAISLKNVGTVLDRTAGRSSGAF